MTLITIAFTSCDGQKYNPSPNTEVYDTTFANIKIEYKTRDHAAMSGPCFIVSTKAGEMLQVLDYWGRPILISNRWKVTFTKLQPEKLHPVRYITLSQEQQDSVANIWYRIKLH